MPDARCVRTPVSAFFERNFASVLHALQDLPHSDGVGIHGFWEMLTCMVRQAGLEAQLPVTPEQLEQSRVNLQNARAFGDEQQIRRAKNYHDFLRRNLRARQEALSFFRDVLGLSENDIHELLQRMPRVRRV